VIHVIARAGHRPLTRPVGKNRLPETEPEPDEPPRPFHENDRLDPPVWTRLAPQHNGAKEVLVMKLSSRFALGILFVIGSAFLAVAAMSSSPARR